MMMGAANDLIVIFLGLEILSIALYVLAAFNHKRAESGEANLTLGALAALAAVLGAEASVRLYPATGPRLRDHIQVELIETLLAP